MKIFLTSLTFMLVFSSCADKTAFSRFEMSKEQELTASSLQSSKIVSGERVDGIFSAIYLNEIYPDSMCEHESFYISLFLKQDREDFKIKLNGKLPLSVEKLPHANKFSHLALVENEWNSYYLVTFEKDAQTRDRLILQLESGLSSVAVLTYQKDVQ
ncbi:MAG: hypothetical protein NTZ60_02720 [Campylobacterales bacterium]|nr:hypothetical protein [Campylobacterales bacterium]